MVLRQKKMKLAVGRTLRIDSALTFFVIRNLICYYREVRTRTKCHSCWRNRLLQCLWSKPASEQHSHAVTAINLYLTSSQQAVYHVEMLCLLKLLIYAPSDYLLTSRFTVLRPVTFNSASRTHTKSQFLFFFNPGCKCDHSSFTLWKRTGNVVPVSKNHTMNMCGRAEEQVRTHVTSGSATCYSMWACS
jgi:hypothetical protein